MRYNMDMGHPPKNRSLTVIANTTLEQILHNKYPAWGDSVRSARLEAGFSFELKGNDLWTWLVSGGHEEVKEIAKREVKRLGTEDLYGYYLSCFYSDYEGADGIIEFEKIKGPPWITMKCPAVGFGEGWRDSIQHARETIDNRLGNEDGLANGNISHEFLAWYFDNDGAKEIAQLAVDEVKRLHLEEINAVLWVCCLSPIEVHNMISQSELFSTKYPQLMNGSIYRLECQSHKKRQRCRAYPAGIDWNWMDEGESSEYPISIKDSPTIRARLGVSSQVLCDPSSNLVLNVTWDPTVVTGAKDATEAVRDLHRYYEQVYKYKPRTTPGVHEGLIDQARKGGRPHSKELDQIALESAKLKDGEGWTLKQIAARYGYPMEKDDHEKLTQSRRTSRLIERGRRLGKQNKKMK